MGMAYGTCGRQVRCMTGFYWGDWRKDTTGRPRCRWEDNN